MASQFKSVDKKEDACGAEQIFLCFSLLLWDQIFQRSIYTAHKSIFSESLPFPPNLLKPLNSILQ